ncbi:MAG: TIGR00282 family metallophosphoesterase [Chloroflexi bacterium]|nr:TIGR00282 family metallophosphoesterase [Chloroflexota bacterium]
MNILFIGDIVGHPGRRIVKHFLPILRREYHLDLVIANGENAAHGRGITPKIAEELLDAGVDVLTSGNHVWDQKEILPHMDSSLPLLRPLNYPQGVPGRGSLIHSEVLVVNLMGRTFMADLDCPFRTMDKFLATLVDPPKVIFVDFHAEATSEKVAMGWYLDGRVSVVVGTHTHVPTADPRLLPKATAVVTDVGMAGPSRSVIGNEIEAVLARFLTQMPHALPVADGPTVLNSVLVEVDASTGRAKSIVRIDRQME